MKIENLNSRIQSIRSQVLCDGTYLLEIFRLTENTPSYSVYHGLEVKSPLMYVM